MSREQFGKERMKTRMDELVSMVFIFNGECYVHQITLYSDFNVYPVEMQTMGEEEWDLLIREFGNEIKKREG